MSPDQLYEYMLELGFTSFTTNYGGYLNGDYKWVDIYCLKKNKDRINFTFKIGAKIKVDIYSCINKKEYTLTFKDISEVDLQPILNKISNGE